jgi:hypothetical protein
MDRFLANTYNQKTPLGFYNKLYSHLNIMKKIASYNTTYLYKRLPYEFDSENKTLSDTYILLRLINFWQVGHLILNKFQVEPCKLQDNYTLDLASTCFNPSLQDTRPIIVGNRKFEYFEDPDPLSIVGTYGTFDTNGYILPFNLGNETEYNMSLPYFE